MRVERRLTFFKVQWVVSLVLSTKHTGHWVLRWFNLAKNCSNCFEVLRQTICSATFVKATWNSWVYSHIRPPVSINIQQRYLIDWLQVDKGLVPNKLKSLLANGEWARSEELCLTLKPVLLSLCARWVLDTGVGNFSTLEVCLFAIGIGISVMK